MENSGQFQSGEKHPRWENQPTKQATLRRLARKFGDAKGRPCNECGKPAIMWSNEKGNYTMNIADYKPRCRSCHVIHGMKINQGWRTNIKKAVIIRHQTIRRFDLGKQYEK